VLASRKGLRALPISSLAKQPQTITNEHPEIIFLRSSLLDNH